jgi:hypothetical protein
MRGWPAVLLFAQGGCLADNPEWGEDVDASTEVSGTSASVSAGSMTSAGTGADTASGSGSTSAADSTSSGSGVDVYRDNIVMDGPLAYWRLGDATTPVAEDELGMYPGEYQGSVSLGAPGLVASDDDAVRLGGNTRVVIGDVLDLAGDPSLTVEVWVAPDFTDDSWPKIVTKSGSDANGKQGYTMEISPEGNVSCALFSDDEWTGVNAPIEMGVTSHVVLTHDGVTARLYINGEEVGSFVRALPIRDTDAPLTFGSNALVDGGSNLSGVLDEVAIYDYPLSAARIREHYETGLP